MCQPRAINVNYLLGFKSRDDHVYLGSVWQMHIPLQPYLITVYDTFIGYDPHLAPHSCSTYKAI